MSRNTRRVFERMWRQQSNALQIQSVQRRRTARKHMHGVGGSGEGCVDTVNSSGRSVSGARKNCKAPRAMRNEKDTVDAENLPESHAALFLYHALQSSCGSGLSTFLCCIPLVRALTCPCIHVCPVIATARSWRLQLFGCVSSLDEWFSRRALSLPSVGTGTAAFFQRFWMLVGVPFTVRSLSSVAVAIVPPPNPSRVRVKCTRL